MEFGTIFYSELVSWGALVNPYICDRIFKKKPGFHTHNIKLMILPEMDC